MAAPSPARGPEMTRPDGSPLRVLVVDDEVEHRRADLDGAALRGLARSPTAHTGTKAVSRPRRQFRPTPSCST